MILIKNDNYEMTETSSPVIDVSDLQVGYGKNVVLHGISFAVDAGECVAITGNNGSGKSTLLKALLGTLPLLQGAIDLLGYTRSANGPAVGPPPWYHLGYVPQRLASAGGIDSTVQEMVMSGLLGTEHLFLPRGWRDTVRVALETVGMAHRSKEAFQTLSGGQQQRVLIARALVRQPELLLLDEPLTGLDEHNRVRLKDILEDNLRGGRTAVLVLHELGELRPLINREIRIGSGHIVHDGPCTHSHHRNPQEPWHDHHYDMNEATHA